MEVVALQGGSPTPTTQTGSRITGGPQCVSELSFVLLLCVCVCECNVHSALLSLKKSFNENFLIPSSQAACLGPVLFISYGRQLHLSQ